MREVAMAMELPFIPVASVLLAGGLGYLADKRWHTFPVLTLLFGLLGFAGGVREILRRISKEEK